MMAVFVIIHRSVVRDRKRPQIQKEGWRFETGLEIIHHCLSSVVSHALHLARMTVCKERCQYPKCHCRETRYDKAFETAHLAFCCVADFQAPARHIWHLVRSNADHDLLCNHKYCG